MQVITDSIRHLMQGKLLANYFGQQVRLYEVAGCGRKQSVACTQ